MNSHLNVFNTYTKVERTYQLENDLTRAFAICLQEDALFFNEVLKEILGNDKELDLIFSNTEIDNVLSVNIQVNTSSINSYDKIIAVSLSEIEMKSESFKNQSHPQEYNPICDVVIQLNDIVIIIEAKRDGVDCTAQLYNQAYNIVRNSSNIENFDAIVEPRDLNWTKLMQIASKVLSFQRTFGSVNRFTFDFVNLVKGHNPNWLPETPIAALTPSNKQSINRRVESALNQLDITGEYQKLTYNDRLGLVFSRPWAKEILFHISNQGDLVITVYAGNTKAQGWHLFSRDIEIAKTLNIGGNEYELNQGYHIKLSSFQKFFAGLWIADDAFKKPGLYSTENYHNYSGRNFRNKGHWTTLEQLFDEYFLDSFDWRKELKWEERVVNSNKSQFDLSFGYEISLIIPFDELKVIDTSSTSLEGLVNLIRSCYKVFEEDLIK